MPIALPMSTDPQADPLRDGPPNPAMRSAKPARPMGMPRPDPALGPNGAAHLLGGGSPIAGVMSDVMEIDKRIKSLAQIRPDIAQLFAPVLNQARDMLAGSLADLAQGGSGMPGQDVGMPPPPAAGPGGMPGGLPPMPPTPQ